MNYAPMRYDKRRWDRAGLYRALDVPVVSAVEQRVATRRELRRRALAVALDRLPAELLDGQLRRRREPVGRLDAIEEVDDADRLARRELHGPSGVLRGDLARGGRLLGAAAGARADAGALGGPAAAGVAVAASTTRKRQGQHGTHGDNHQPSPLLHGVHAISSLVFLLPLGCGVLVVINGLRSCSRCCPLLRPQWL